MASEQNIFLTFKRQKKKMLNFKSNLIASHFHFEEIKIIINQNVNDVRTRITHELEKNTNKTNKKETATLKKTKW